MARLHRWLREILILRAAQLQGARYVWDDHEPMAIAAGVEPALIEALASWKDSPSFDGRTRLALQFAEEMVEGHVATATLAALEPAFDPGERVELMLTVGFYCMTPRILDALRLPVQPNSESEKAD
jgi:alkylhydroperoxidase family enzyme